MGLLVKLREISVIAAMICISAAMLVYISTPLVAENNDEVFIHSEELAEDTTETPLLDSILCYIDSLNLKHPNIVKAQMIIESGYAKRTKGNNFFGMHVAKNRPTTALNRSGYAIYSSWQESVLDYALFQAAYCRKLSRDEYLSYICKNYAEDKKYGEKIEWVIKNKL